MRLTDTHPPWSFREVVTAHAAGVTSMLDMGTGGGEQLARLASLPPLTVATESWPPNVPVAARRLRPLGVRVVQTEGAPDNDEQAPDEPLGRLPFRDRAFELVTNRHESFNAREVARVLAAGGTFLTQQVGDDAADLHDLLGLPAPPPRWTLALAERQVRAAGLDVEAGDSAVVTMTFADVGVLGWYLRQVPWAVPGFDIGRDRDRLRAVHRRIAESGPATVRQRQFWLRATRR
jgi:SAM-dependent methyltransferase